MHSAGFETVESVLSPWSLVDLRDPIHLQPERRGRRPEAVTRSSARARLLEAAALEGETLESHVDRFASRDGAPGRAQKIRRSPSRSGVAQFFGLILGANAERRGAEKGPVRL